jgi:hypothetical protein
LEDSQTIILAEAIIEDGEMINLSKIPDQLLSK